MTTKSDVLLNLAILSTQYSRLHECFKNMELITDSNSNYNYDELGKYTKDLMMHEREWG